MAVPTVVAELDKLTAEIGHEPLETRESWGKRMSTRRERGSNRAVLNVRKVESLKAAEGQERTEYWDVGLPGFGVRVSATGRKTYTVRYSLHGQQRRKDLGIHGVTTSFADARAEAAQLISEARNGRDPELPRVMLAKAGIESFSDLCARFEEDRLPALRESTGKEMRRVIGRELLPLWGARDPNSIQPEEIDAWTHTLVKRAPYVANRSFEYMRLIYNYAIKRRMLRYTPFLGLERPHTETVRTRTFNTGELRRIFEALREEPVQMAGMWVLLFLTGTRLRETLKGEWAWIDERERCLLLPKTATKNGREHLLPLVPAAMTTLAHLRRLARQSPYVLPGPKGTPIHWAQRSAERVWEKAEIEDGRLHDVRRTVSTGLARLGVTEDIIERTLNHTRPGDRLLRTYNTYQYIPEKREALERWERELTAVLGHEPCDVLLTERKGYQGKGGARRLARRETWAQRKARLAALGRDLEAEHRERQRERLARARGGDADPAKPQRGRESGTVD